MSLVQVVNIGHSASMLPLAAGIAAYLMAGRAFRPALWWTGTFLAGLGFVALSKLIFLGWSISIPGLSFQALSGHAFRVASVIPTLFFLMLKPTSEFAAKRGVVVGITTSLCIDLLLVYFRFHTFSEVIASTILGFGACLIFIRFAGKSAFSTRKVRSALCAMIAIIVVFLISPWSYNHRLIDIAIYLSGKDSP